MRRIITLLPAALVLLGACSGGGQSTGALGSVAMREDASATSTTVAVDVDTTADGVGDDTAAMDLAAEISTVITTHAVETSTTLDTPSTTVVVPNSTLAPAVPTTTVPKASTTTTAPKVTPTTTVPVVGPTPEDALWDGPVQVRAYGVVDIDGVRHSSGNVERCARFETRTVRFWVSYVNGAEQVYTSTVRPEPENSSYDAGITVDPFGNQLTNGGIGIATDPALPYFLCTIFTWSNS